MPNYDERMKLIQEYMASRPQPEEPIADPRGVIDPEGYKDLRTQEGLLNASAAFMGQDKSVGAEMTRDQMREKLAASLEARRSAQAQAEKQQAIRDSLMQRSLDAELKGPADAKESFNVYGVDPATGAPKGLVIKGGKYYDPMTDQPWTGDTITKEELKGTRQRVGLGASNVNVPQDYKENYPTLTDFGDRKSVV